MPDDSRYSNPDTILASYVRHAAEAPLPDRPTADAQGPSRLLREGLAVWTLAT